MGGKKEKGSGLFPDKGKKRVKRRKDLSSNYNSLRRKGKRTKEKEEKTLATVLFGR